MLVNTSPDTVTKTFINLVWIELCVSAKFWWFGFHTSLSLWWISTRDLWLCHNWYVYNFKYYTRTSIIQSLINQLSTLCKLVLCLKTFGTPMFSLILVSFFRAFYGVFQITVKPQSYSPQLTSSLYYANLPLVLKKCSWIYVIKLIGNIPSFTESPWLSGLTECPPPGSDNQGSTVFCIYILVRA